MNCRTCKFRDEQTGECRRGTPFVLAGSAHGYWPKVSQDDYCHEYVAAPKPEPKPEPAPKKKRGRPRKN